MAASRTRRALDLAAAALDHLLSASPRPEPADRPVWRPYDPAERAAALRYDRDAPAGTCALVDWRRRVRPGLCGMRAARSGPWMGICEAHRAHLLRQQVSPEDIRVLPRRPR